MSGDIVNLRNARKAKARAAREAQAAESRARSGRTKAQRVRDEDEKSRIARELDGARRQVKDKGDGGGGDGGK